MDTSPFLLVTANTLQGGCWPFFFFFLFFSSPLSACDRQSFLLCGCAEVFDTLLLLLQAAAALLHGLTLSLLVDIPYTFLSFVLLWYFPENASFILTPYFSLTVDFPTKA